MKIKPESIILIAKSGKAIEVKNGMMMECRIIYAKITYFDYFMDAIGMKIKES